MKNGGRGEEREGGRIRKTGRKLFYLSKTKEDKMYHLKQSKPHPTSPT